MSGPGETGFGGCDPEKVFELADRRAGAESLDPEQERKMREHFASCPECRELYERELDLNAFLSSLDFSELRARSVSQGVAMTLPTRSSGARLLWGLLASALLLVAFFTSGFNGTESVLPLMRALGACWDFVTGSAEVAHEVFAVAGSTILILLALGAMMDLLIAFVVLLASRHRRTRAA
jgi:hypothetical protein